MRKIAVVTLIFCLFLCSCSTANYTDSLSCQDITSELRKKLLGSELYDSYTDEDTKLILSDDQLYDSSSIIYSVSSDDIGEVGILHAPDTNTAKDLLGEVTDYIESLKDEKQEFIKNYLPSELSKLNYADARRFGNYVAYTVLTSDRSEEVFSFVEKMLHE